MAGADYAVLGRMKMGVHLSYLVYLSEANGKNLYELFITEFKEVSVEEKSGILEKLVLWLLLNNPHHKSKSDTCSNQLLRITKFISENLPTEKDIVLVLLPNILKEVNKFDNMILNNCHKLGIERSVSLQNNSNSIISQLFSVCFQNKELFNDFLVKKEGFDFLLQRLFSKYNVDEQIPEEESKGDDEEENIVTERPFKETTNSLENLFKSEENEEETNKENEEEKYEENKEIRANKKKGIEKVALTDAGKTMKLIETSFGVENTTQDWVMYKNGQRNRIILKNIDK